MKEINNKSAKVFLRIGKFLLSLACVLVSVVVFGVFSFSGSAENVGSSAAPADYAVMNRYDKYINNTFSDTLDGIMSIKKVYWLSDEDIVAPEPNQSCYGESDDPAEIVEIIKQAEELLDGQTLLFKPDADFLQGSSIKYYYDETLLVLTWKIPLDNSVYTFSEVKIADASQFRRFLSDGQYGSGAKYLTSEMAGTVNAVVAVNGDYYAMRDMGTIIYNSQLMRNEGTSMDGCYIDKNGNLRMIPARELTDEQEVRKFMEEEGVRFSLAFGPILIEDGELLEVKRPYPVGEAGGLNARAALCQMDSLHYVIVMSSPEPPYAKGVTLDRFAQTLYELGIKNAYNLDGGRSGALVMNDELINYVYERKISDILYFATAISNGE